MKRLSRLTALLLAMALLLTSFGFAEGVKVEDLDAAIWKLWTGDDSSESTGETSADPVITTGGEVIDQGDATQDTTEAPLYDSELKVEVAMNAAGSEGEQSVSLSQYGKADLTVNASGCQWQVNIAGQWIDVAGETGATFSATYAKLQSVFMLNNTGAAQVRCVAADGTVSDTVTVYLGYAPMTVPELDDDLAVATSYSATGDDSGIALADATSEDSTDNQKWTVVINYVFAANGNKAANPWTATVNNENPLSITVKSPEVLGYTPEVTEVVINETSVTGNLTFTVKYYAAEVKVTVEHYQQNKTDDEYTLVETEARSGYTDSAVGSGLAKTNYTGFYALLYDETTKIAADGSTVIEIYYDRYYYLMSFDLAGGYGVEPIYARYGVEISVGTPKKAGYVFAGWKNGETEVGLTIPYDTMPAENIDYTAIWTPGTTSFTVVYWYENADDNGYTSVGSQKVEGVTSGTEVSTATYQDGDHALFTGITDANDPEYELYKHFTYNSELASTVTVNGDGSTMLHVYYTRNKYTLTFVGDKLTCTQEVHSHSDSCYTCGLTEHSHDWNCGWGWNGYNCGLSEHSHSNCSIGCGKSEHEHNDNCYSSDQTILTVTAKYDSDISYVWQTDPIKSMLDDGYVFQSSITGKYYSFLEKMPKQDITMTSDEWSGSTYTWYYYLEVLPGVTYEETTRTDDDVTYFEYDSTTVKGWDVSLTYEEDYFPITGFTQRDDKVPSFNNRVAYLYYTRNSYNLSFHNYGTTVTGKGGTYLYEASIANTNFVPDYPSTLEQGAYTFDGWYTSPFFGDTKFNFTGATMPAHDVTLYAHWVPVKHDVKLYLTKEDMLADTNQIGSTETVDHGATATEPADPTRGEYIFVGWFYMDGETEKAFDFSMPVNQNLNLYAKWSSNKLMEYTIHYELADGTKIADDTTGSALAGTSKTFDAKYGEKLYDLSNEEGGVNYQQGYYPNTNSHTISIDINNAANNEFTFIYSAAEKLPYVVMYLEYDGNNVYDGTETVLHPKKEVETSDAVIDETFVTIEGYMPDAYQKRLVLSTNTAENVIIFWYVTDDTHAPVKIVHYIQNVDGKTYTEHLSTTDLNGVIENSYSADVLTIPNYTYDHATANKTEVVAENGKVTGTVTSSGLLLELYYNRNQYPYEFRFLEQGTNKELATPSTGDALYEAQVIENAKTIYGYTCVSDSLQQSIIIQSDANSNVRTFYYQEDKVEYNYVIVPPEGDTSGNCGTLSLAGETVAVISGEPEGSIADPNDPTYKFIGWYTDAECKNAVPAEWLTETEDGTKIIPQKVDADSNTETEDIYNGGTFYAKFAYNLADLTITKDGTNETLDPNQTFIFKVTGFGLGDGLYVSVDEDGSCTISGLTVGETYTITEQTTWSWRYTPKKVYTVEINPVGTKTEVVVENSRPNVYWLDGNAESNTNVHE